MGGSLEDPLLEPLKKVAVGKCRQGSFNHREGVASPISPQYYIIARAQYTHHPGWV